MLHVELWTETAKRVRAIELKLAYGKGAKIYICCFFWREVIVVLLCLYIIRFSPVLHIPVVHRRRGGVPGPRLLPPATELRMRTAHHPAHHKGPGRSGHTDKVRIVQLRLPIAHHLLYR
jgi:hypothetical protein